MVLDCVAEQGPHAVQVDEEVDKQRQQKQDEQSPKSGSVEPDVIHPQQGHFGVLSLSQ